MQLYKQTLQLYYETVQKCELEWARDNRMATVIQAYQRMHVLYKTYQRNRQAAITIQKYSRGYLARKHSKLLRWKSRNNLNLRYFSYQAQVIQRYFKGFLMRKYTTDFYARKRQLLALIKKNEEFLIELNEVARIEKVDEENRKEQNAREEFSKLAKNLHHLSSTAVQPGIYKPPYSQIPKAFDIDIETHLKVAFQTTNRAKTAKASNGGFRIRPTSQRAER